MPKNNRSIRLLIAALLGALPGAALAQGEFAAEELEKAVRADVQESEDGWKVNLSIGGSASFNHSSSVVGQDDGATLQVGIVLNSAARLRHEQHDWETTLNIQHSQTRTPQLQIFVKSLDLLEVKSTYLYRLKRPSWLGPFARATLLTQIFPGNAVRTTDTVVLRTDREGNVERQNAAARTNIRLTEGFEPLTLRQSAGFFADLLDSQELKVKAKAGGGAQEIISRRGYTVQDDAATPELELAQLRSSVELGAEAELSLSGEPAPNLLTWSVTANAFLPFVSTDDAEFDFADQLNLKVNARVSVKLSEALSLDYVLNVLRLPRVQPDYQVQNGLIFNANFSLL